MSSHQDSHDAAAAAYPRGDYDSDHSYGAPAFPSTPTPSNMPFPHQSSLGSGTTVLEPSHSGHSGSDPGLTGAQNIQNRWREAQQNPMPMPYTSNGGSSARGGHGNEMSEKSSRLSSNHGYSNPYDSGDPSDGTSRSGQQPPSPSIGPWDSASQRFPIAQPSIIPLSGEAKHLRNKPSYAGGLSYIDEEGAYYKSEAQRPASALNGDELEMRGLVGNAAGMGHFDDDRDIERNKLNFTEYDQSPSPYPLPPEPTGRNVEPSGLSSSLLFSTGLDRLLGLFGSKAGKFPVQQAIERKRRGLGGQRWPVASWVLTVVMCSLMVYELVKNNSITGSPIATKPQFNYMIGPQPSVLINIGARFPPCMKLVSALPPSFPIACMNDTNNPPTSTCTIEEICGHGGFDGGPPNQSWRFVVPIFLHVGIIHLLLNMVAQVTAAAQVEREMGTIPFLLTYLAGGIYGFVLGGNFSRTGIPSVGASGALFATNACVLVDLVLHWKYEERPKLKAFLLFIEFAIGFGIGYIPNAVDGLAHLGGWAIGILMGIVLYPSISETKRRRYILWGVRVLALALLVMAFVLTIRNFYTDDPNAACTWCKYLSCIPTASNSRCSGTGITTTQVQSTRRSWDSL